MIPRKDRRSLINDYGTFDAEAHAIGDIFQARLKKFISEHQLEYLRPDELENLLVSEVQLLFAHMRLEQAISQKKHERKEDETLLS